MEATSEITLAAWLCCWPRVLLDQARFYWRPGEDDAHGAGSCVISICDVDFKYRFEYLGCKVTLMSLEVDILMPVG